MVALTPDDWRPEDAGFPAFLRRLAADFPGSAYLAASFRYAGDDRLRIGRLSDLAAACGTPLVATNDVHYHVPERRALQAEIGRAACRERVCQYVWITVVGLSLQKNNNT